MFHSTRDPTMDQDLVIYILQHGVNLVKWFALIMILTEWMNSVCRLACMAGVFSW